MYFITAAVLLLSAIQVSAYPSKWDGLDMCELPTAAGFPYKAHKTPMTDTGITFALMNGTTPVTTWVPGKSYTLMVSHASPRLFWVITSAGTFTALTNTTLGCDSQSLFASVNTPPVTEFAGTWNAPATCSSVKVSVNSAGASADNFHQNSVDLACDGASPSTSPSPSPSPAVPPADGAVGMGATVLAVISALLAMLL